MPGQNLDSIYRLRDLQRAFNDHLRDLIAQVKKRRKRPKKDPKKDKPPGRHSANDGGNFSQLGQNTPQGIGVSQGGGHSYNPPSLSDCMKRFTSGDKFDVMGRLGCKCKFGDKHACEQLSQMMATEHPQSNSGGGGGGGF